MQYKALATIFFAATALAAPADSTSTSASLDFADNNDLYDDYYEDIYDDIYEAVPSSILTVLATAIPATWYNDLLDPASRDSIVSEAMAGTYPAWYNSLPSSVKAWATSNAELIGASATATQTEATDGSTFKTGSTAAASHTSFASETSAASQTPDANTSTPTTSSASTTSSSSSSQSSSESSSESSSASSSPSSSQSTGGAPAPTGGITMGVAGAAGVLALALAL